jgi:hypothetical protein
VINVERLWTNLLTSQALTFNLFGPFKQRPALATAVMRRPVPNLVGEVTDVRFERPASPRQGQLRSTNRYVASADMNGGLALIVIELHFPVS